MLIDMKQITDERLMSRINHVNGCWLHNGAPTQGGYVQIERNNERIYIHRYTYQLAKGPIPNGMTIDHLCNNRNCCNPAHLEAKPWYDNYKRGRINQNKNKSHCKRGHEFTDTNTKWYAGNRSCRTCFNDLRRIRRAKAKGIT